MLNTKSGTANPPRLGADGRIHERVSIACSWKEGAHGLVIEAINLEPAPKGREHREHEISVYGGVLMCDCQSYFYSHWTPSTAKDCAHLSGNDGLDGAAAWLETQSKRRDLTMKQRAITTASINDPHRAYVRAEKQRRARADSLLPIPTASEAVQWSQAIADDVPDDPKGNRRADASKGYRLEQFFQG